MENVSSSSHGPSDAQFVRSPVSAVNHDTLVKIFSFLDVKPGDDGKILADPPIRLRPIPRPIISEPVSPATAPDTTPPLMPPSFTTHLYRTSLVCKAFFSPAMDLLWQSMDSFVPILNLLPTMKKIGDVFMFTEDIQGEHVERFKMYGSRIRKFTLTEGDQLQIAPFALLHIASIIPNIPHVLCFSAQALSSSTASILLTNGLERFELTNVTDTAVQVIKPFLCTLQAKAPELKHLVFRDSLGSETLSVISTYQSLISLELVGNIDIVLFSQIVTLPELRKLILNVADSTPVETPRTANLISLKKLETLHITGSGPTIESFILRLEGSSLVDVGVTVQPRILPTSQDLIVPQGKTSSLAWDMPDLFLGRSLTALSTQWPALRSLRANITNRPSTRVPVIDLNAIKRLESLENLYLGIPLRPTELLDLAAKLSNLITLRVEIVETDLLDFGYLSSVVNTSRHLVSLNIKFGLCGICVDSMTSFSLNPHLKTLIINATHDSTTAFKTTVLVGEYLDKVFPGLQRVEIEPCPGALFWQQVREIVMMIQRVRKRVEREIMTRK